MANKKIKKKKIQEPAITSIMPVNATSKEKIQFLKRQIAELKQQKKCYDRMIKLREKAIKEYQKFIDFQDITPDKLWARSQILPKQSKVLMNLFKEKKRRPKRKHAQIQHK